MTRPVHQVSHLFGRLQRGEALVCTQQADGRTWSMAGDGRTIEADVAAMLTTRRFLGGSLRPAGDHLPGIATAASQTWLWVASPARKPRSMKRSQQLSAGDMAHG